MLSDTETVPSAKTCQDVISLKRGSLKFQWSHTLTHTHTQRLLVKHWIAHRKWLFGNLVAPPMAHQASTRPLFISGSSLRFSCLPVVHGRGCLPTLCSWTRTPSLRSVGMSGSDTDTVQSKSVISAAETWKSPCLRILMKCRETGPKASFELEPLSEAKLHTQAVFDQRTAALPCVFLTNANGCFSCLIILFH